MTEQLETEHTPIGMTVENGSRLNCEFPFYTGPAGVVPRGDQVWDLAFFARSRPSMLNSVGRLGAVPVQVVKILDSSIDGMVVLRVKRI